MNYLAASKYLFNFVLSEFKSLSLMIIFLIAFLIMFNFNIDFLIYNSNIEVFGLRLYNMIVEILI